jgi:hypothetical protein
VPRWTVIAFAAAGPLIGLFGVAIGLLQPVGAALLIASGAVMATRLGPAAATAGDIDNLVDPAPVDHD